MFSRKRSPAEARKPETGLKCSYTSSRVNEPNDSSEQEADRVAEAVLNGGRSASWSLSKVKLGNVERQTAPTGLSDHPTPKPNNYGEAADKLAEGDASALKGAVAPPIVHKVLNSPGQPLDAQARSFFEPRFGRDFSKVKVHTNSQATASAGALKALAFTNGNNIVFGAGEYSPSTPWGGALIAHELAHVLQQEASKNQILQRKPTADQPTPSPPTHLSPLPPRQDFVFIMGKDRASNRNKFYTAALRYYKAHLPKATFVTSVRNLTDLLDHLLTNTKGPIGNLYIVSPANEDGARHFGIDP